MKKTVSRKVELVGITPIMFDRYSGNNKEQLDVMEKCYREDNFLVFPSLNIMSFLSSMNSESATQRTIGRGWKEVAKSALSYIQITPFMISIEHGKKRAEVSDLKVHTGVAKIKKGNLVVPNPKIRPYLDLPWSMSFNLSLFETPELNEVLLKKIFEIGGSAIGLGTFRGVFGKFEVSKWE
jgi:hypothetical protein